VAQVLSGDPKVAVERLNRLAQDADRKSKPRDRRHAVEAVWKQWRVVKSRCARLPGWLVFGEVSTLAITLLGLELREGQLLTSRDRERMAQANPTGRRQLTPAAAKILGVPYPA
jgi:hypothetical protein